MASFLCFNKLWILCILLVLLFSYQSPHSLAAEKDTPKSEEFSGIDIKDGLLKVSVRKQSFIKVMDEIAKKADIKILVYYAAEEEITVDFDYLPLEKGLLEILKGRNYAFCRSREDQQPDRLSSVMVFDRKEGVSVAVKDAIGKLDLDQQQRLDEIMQSISMDSNDPKEQVNEAMEQTMKIDIQKEIAKLKDAFSQDEQSGVKKISSALEEVQHDFLKRSK